MWKRKEREIYEGRLGGTGILGGLLWDSIGVELEFHASLRDAANGYIEEDDWIGVIQVLHTMNRRFVRHVGLFFGFDVW